MPSYDLVQQRMASYGNAASLLPKLKQIYQQAQEVSVAITLYQSGSDQDFVTAINAIYSVPERQELAAMLTDLQTLVNAWQAEHTDLLAESEV